MRAAVIAHVYYPQLVAELAAAIRNVDVPYDLFVTYVDEAAVVGMRREFPDARYVRTENRGYDLWPFVCVLQDLPRDRYDIVVKLHTKRDIDWDMVMNRRTFYGAAWREKLLSFVATPAAWRKSLSRLMRAGVGMVAPAELAFARDTTGPRYVATFDRACAALADCCGTRPPADARYVGGTMFAARYAAFAPLLTRRYTAGLFEPSAGHETETFAHVMERMLGLSVACAGLRIEGSDTSVAWSAFVNGRSPLIRFCRFFYKRQYRDWKMTLYILHIPIYSRPIRRPTFALSVLMLCLATFAQAGETLYNGIRLPDEWPPKTLTPQSPRRLPVPYLDAANIPATIPIDVGRQLFVDDFLVAATDGVTRVWHHPRKYEGNPVLKPETPWEVNTPGNAAAVPKGGGLWWDSSRGVFHFWYESGWCREICYAWSKDGIRWERPALDIVPGSNRLLPNQHVDSWSVFPEPNPKDGRTRWNLYIMPGGESLPGRAYTSVDGIHWRNGIDTGLAGDRSNMFYNPFRRKWVWSLRASWRARSTIYHEADEFLAGTAWHWPFPRATQSWRLSKSYTNTVDCSLWLAADDLDVQTTRKYENRQASLYAFNAVGYESIMLGAFEIHWGPENDVCMKYGKPKITEIQFAYSRDGFHFSRPDRTAAIPAERWDAYGRKWDIGYVQPLSNICVIKRDELWFYYCAFGGDTSRLVCDSSRIPHSGNGNLNGIYANAATGVAFLRRDGFCSFSAVARGTVTTRPLVFSGKKLFANFAAPKGSLAVEVLAADEDKVLARVPAASGDATKRMLGDVAAFAGQRVRLRFTLEKADLYAFWVAPDEKGKSGGYLAGGGPGYAGYCDR